MVENLNVRVFRYNPPTDTHPRFETYEVPYQRNLMVLDVLLYIRRHFNVDLGFRYSCKSGVCGTCSLLVNGEPCCACRREAEGDMVVEPLPSFPVLRDLVVDRRGVAERFLQVKPFLELETPPKPYALLKASDVEDYRHVAKCIECYSCIAACPVVQELKPSEYMGPALMVQLGQLAFNPLDRGNRGKTAYLEGVYNCTTCAKCSEVCPKDIAIPEATIEKLRRLAVDGGIGPLEAHRQVANLIVATGRAVEKTTTPLLQGLGGEVLKVEEPRSRVGFFTGCLIDYRLQNAGLSALNILKKSNVEVVVPKEQVCCGSLLVRTGQSTFLGRLVERNIEAFTKLGVETVVTGCAGCSLTLKQNYPVLVEGYLGVEMPFTVYHLSEYLTKVCRMRLNRMRRVEMKVTYHDPCHLKRRQSIHEEPRELLGVVPGLQLVEMENADWCCGAGGGVRSGLRELSLKIGGRKADFIRQTGADILVTECPFCVIQLTDVVKAAGLNVPVLYLEELVDKAYL